MAKAVEDLIRERAAAFGFDICAITSPTAIQDAAAGLKHFVDSGYHGDMTWIANTLERRSNPQALWPQCQSVIMLGVNYGGGGGANPLARLQETGRGVIARYAKGRDYHDVIKGRLKQVAGGLAALPNIDVKVFVDTAPLLEKPLAHAAGVGWQGKHTNLVSQNFGSWLFLGAILTNAELTVDHPVGDHCGSCRRCLDICPTDAFPTPYQLDARRCIAYLTIEYEGHIAQEFRAAMGNRVFGCDDCLAVCPWNKFAQLSQEARFAARDETDDPPIEELLTMDDGAFRKRFQGTPVKRTGRDRFLRNVLIAAGNSGDHAYVPKVVDLLSDGAAVVRAMAVWALHRIGQADEFEAAFRDRFERETDAAVRTEWTRARQGLGDRA